MEADMIQENFHLPLSPEAFSNLQMLQTSLQGLEINQHQDDSWICVQSKGSFIPHTYYLSCFAHLATGPASTWI
jgi:hypothetical protein